MEFPLVKMLIPAIIAFVVGIMITPLVTRYLYKCKVWKKTGGKTAMNGEEAVVFNAIKGKDEHKTPRMGGIVIWGSVIITTLGFYLGGWLFGGRFEELNYLSRSQTWIPFTALIVGAAIGFWNDFYDVTHRGREVTIKLRLIIISLLAGMVGYWFYAKLGVDTIGIPFAPDLYVGWLIIPAFVFLANFLYASGVIDGIDGLSGGVFTATFTAYAAIAFIQGQFDIAAFAATIAGATMAFLWFNIPPARFWMTETGSMALTLTLAVIVFMTDALGEGYGITLLLIAGLPLVVTVLSAIIQVLSKRFLGRKVFRIAPLHHHFEAIGWPAYKVTMRYWVISFVCALLSVVLASIAHAIG